MEKQRTLPEPKQREITRLCMWAAQLLMQHGAESAQVEAVAVRLGAALGLENVHVGITANAILLTTVCEGHCITTVRRTLDHGINMHVVTEVQRTMLLAEAGKIDAEETRWALEQIKPFHYPKPVVAVMIGLSCACFGRLMGADGISCLLVFAASGIAMVARQLLAHWHFNPLVNFAVAAFVATSITSLGTRYAIGEHPDLVMAASVLLLIPGFPLINAVSDMVKGYVNTGVARWAFATLLILSSSMGILLALTLWKVRGWI